MEQKEKWALISVYRKDKIVEFAERLTAMGWKIISSGGTAKKLKDANVKVIDTADFVGGAILGHRVVTLSREIHAGLLADPDNIKHVAEMKELNIPIIDLVCCDFYPLQSAIARPDATIKSVIELTDIGGPAMVRSAAKGERIVICRSQDREIVLEQLKSNDNVCSETRQALRARAEFEVAKYCLDSARFHSQGDLDGVMSERIEELKYGENAWQSPAGYFKTTDEDPLAIHKFKAIEGDKRSSNNVCDIDRMLQTLTHIGAVFFGTYSRIPQIAVAVKHGNPCGAALSARECSDIKIMERAITGNSRAIFGGSIICNFVITQGIAEVMVSAGVSGGGSRVLDCVIAPDFTEKAKEVLKRKTGKCRMMTNLALFDKLYLLDGFPRRRQVRGGLITQPNYIHLLPTFDKMQIFGESVPEDIPDIFLAWAVGCTSNSNTITIVKNGMLLGNGVGQQDRVGAAELAIKRAVDAGHKDKLEDATAYSDSFFPFPDAVEILIGAGIATIFSTSGSRNDKLIQEVCMKNGVTLYQLPDAEARGFFGH